jgi:hypothetical protein
MQQHETGGTVSKRAHFLGDCAVAWFVGCPEIGSAQACPIEQRAGDEQDEQRVTTAPGSWLVSIAGSGPRRAWSVPGNGFQDWFLHGCHRRYPSGRGGAG